LSVSVKGIEADKLHERLLLPKSHDEISQLIVTFNGMLDKLHRSFEGKQLFAQNAAHELKTPLTIIRFHMEALEMEDNPTIDDYEEVFIEVKNNTERMIQLVERLLAMHKSPAEADMTVFQGREIFEAVFLNLKEVIQSKNLNIQILGDLTIKGEKMLLGQAFFNLIHNAVRYNVQGGSIIVNMAQNQITIADTGIGVPPESLGQLFDPFYCVDKSRSKKLGGHGLGLAITKNILDAHDMNISISSDTDAGTLITIRISD
jgi:signal transduction histidine kinase